MIFKVDIEHNKLVDLKNTSFAEHNILERYNIQEWIDNSPQILGEELLIIAKEFRLEEWNRRIDLLAIDKKANLVIIELKRDDSGSDVDLQSLKYASYVSNFTVDRIVETYTEYLEVTQKANEEELKAQEIIENFIDEDTDLEELNNSQRIILVSGDFRREVMSVVLWLRDNYQVDLTCIRLRAFTNALNEMYILPDVIIPIPEAKDYIEQRERKQRESRERKTRFAMNVGNYDSETLVSLLEKTFSSQNIRMQWFIFFTKVLLTENRVFDREEIKKLLVEKGLSEDIGRAGNHMSHISRVLTYRRNDHIRQIYDFDSAGTTGSYKDHFSIKPEYRQLVASVLKSLTSNIEIDY